MFLSTITKKYLLQCFQSKIHATKLLQYTVSNCQLHLKLTSRMLVFHVLLHEAHAPIPDSITSLRTAQKVTQNFPHLLLILHCRTILVKVCLPKPNHFHRNTVKQNLTGNNNTVSPVHL